MIHKMTYRDSLVVLARYTCEWSYKEKWIGLQRQVIMKFAYYGSEGNKFDFYEDVREILIALHDAEIPIALASSTWDPSLYKQVDHLIIEERRLSKQFVSTRNER